ncbi:hypothetical protein Halru_0026 [Halovivax ruber XH-70]|uniref:Uncharacterized protein n=1 Tax=Halovivax ruber (strain DSM 18193 / JCM 13892 / XH-70) TaxID=797302 RepID=L0I576_HALRX|nr:hypothetical protein [Halovivax ruber]AGB14680.1 hypothetical protein Halru_0026 [Halovivax ruber XH-70]
MGSRTEGDDGPIRRTDSLEALLQATDRNTEEIVEALRESGPRRHVSESSVDEVLETASRPQAADDDAFALSGGPTRTISTTGIDEVFETLEAEAPPLSTASRAEAASQPAAEPDTSTSTSESGSTSESTDATDDLTARPLAEVDETQRAEATVASLSGGGPRRTVSEQSVDDILSLLDDEEPDTTDSDAAAADLRPDDAGDALASLLADAEPPAESIEPSSESEEPERSQARNEASVSVESSNTVDAAVSALETHGPDDSDSAEAARGADDSRAEATDSAFEWGPHDTGDEADVSDRKTGPAITEQPPTPDDAGALVTRAELEEIAALVSEPESTPTRPASAESATGHSTSVEPRTVGPTPSGTTDGVTDEATGAPSSPSTVVVSVDTVLAPTAEQVGDRHPVVADRHRRPTSTDSTAGPTTEERATEDGGREPASTGGTVRSLWRRLRKWLSRR